MTVNEVTFVNINTCHGANELYGMNQDVNTTDAVTFATLDTGQGANELYDMNQNVNNTDAVTFATLDTGFGNNAEELRTAYVLMDKVVIRQRHDEIVNGLKEILNCNGIFLEKSSKMNCNLCSKLKFSEYYNGLATR